jgi:hypothetical protein
VPRLTDVLSAEALRLRSRRSSLAIVLLMPLLGVMLTVLQGAVHHDDIAQAQAAFHEDRSARYDEERANFLQMQKTMAEALPATASDLTKEEYVSGREFFGGHDEVLTKRYDARVHIPQTARLMATGLALLAFVLGAVHVGRDWSVGSLAGLLTWYPRRIALTHVKLVVVMAATVLAGLVAFAVVAGCGLAAGSVRGTNEGLTSAWWEAQGWYAVRACGVAALAAALGLGIAHLTRTVTIPLAAGVAVLILDPLFGSFFPAMRPWLVTNLVETVLSWGQRFRTYDGTKLVDSVWVSGPVATITVVLAVAAVVSASIVAFVRRDAV